MALQFPILPIRRPRLRRRTALILGATLYVVLFGLETALLQAPWRQSSIASPMVAPGVDPRLVIPRRTMRIGATLAGHMSLSGTLYPALPGANTLHLTLRGAEGVPLGRLDLVTTMPGMAMSPLRAAMAARHGEYAGTLRLPMFGRYRARIVVRVAGASYAGTMTLLVALPQP